MVPALDAAVVEVRWDCCRSSGSAFVRRYLKHQLIPSELRYVKGLPPITAVGRLEPADHRHANARLRRYPVTPMRRSEGQLSHPEPTTGTGTKRQILSTKQVC